MNRHQTMFATALLLGAAFASPAFAQTKPAAPPAAPNNAARGGFDPAAIRERILGTMKTALACSDDEWKAIEPKLIKVLLLRMDAGALGGFDRAGRGGFRISSFIRTLLDPNALPSAVDEKLTELQTMISQNETSTDAYRNKIAQVRRAREKAREELAAAQAALTALLTPRQEAALVDLGIME